MEAIKKKTIDNSLAVCKENFANYYLVCATAKINRRGKKANERERFSSESSNVLSVGVSNMAFYSLLSYNLLLLKSYISHLSSRILYIS